MRNLTEAEKGILVLAAVMIVVAAKMARQGPRVYGGLSVVIGTGIFWLVVYRGTR